MTVQVINLELEQSESPSFQFLWQDKSTTLPIDLTGYSAKLQIRNNYGDPTVQLELSTANGGITLGGPAGTITVNFTSAQTTVLPVNLGFYDLLLTNIATGAVTEFARGFVYVDPTITSLP